MTFTALVSAFQGLFSRSFWFGSFLPVTTFAAAHLVLASLAFPRAIGFDWASNLDEWKFLPAILAALLVLAYALRPFALLLRGMLDGTLLPEWLHDQLRKPRLPAARRAWTRVETARDDRAHYQLSRKRVVARLQGARKVGTDLGSARQPSFIHDAEKTVAGLMASMQAGDLPKPAEASAAVEKLATALERNASNLPGRHADAAASKRLAAVHRAMLDFLRMAEAESKHLHVLEGTRQGQRLLLSPQATRVGDMRILAQRYPLDVYSVDFDYIWPRLQPLLQDPESNAHSAHISDSQSQIDFSTLSLFLCLTLFAWLPVLAVQQELIAFLALATALPLLVRFFYELMVQSYVVFGEVVEVAIDKYRHQVLTELHQPIPPTLATERALWRQLREAGEGGEMFDLIYKKAGSE